MTVAILAGRAAVAAVLVASGAAKLADLHTFRATLVGLGLSKGAGPASWLVATLELALGVASLSSAWPTATDALVLGLTLAFAGTAAVAAKRAPGLRCRCFGALSDSQFGRKALVRSVVLVALAAAVLVAGVVHEARADWSAPWVVTLLATTALFALASGQAARALGTVQVQEGETA
jgi:hypothetical protein